MLLIGIVPIKPLQAEVTLKRVGDRVDIELDSKPFTSFYFSSDVPKPFLHPLRSPSGVIVTRRYPMENDVPGETADHPWHRGLWFAHGDIQGVDFWREIAEGARYPLPVGRFVFRSLEELKSGETAGTLSAVFDLMGGNESSLGTLAETFTFHRWSGNNVVDVEIAISAGQGRCLKLGDTEEGSFAIRVAPGLRQDKGAILLNAQGAIGTENIWEKPSPWVDYSSEVEGQAVGIAIFDHPRNPKHPTLWHARGYGLFAANPFGEHDFSGNPTRDGGYTVAENETVTFRYRVVIHQGDVKAARVASLYEQYAAVR